MMRIDMNIICEHFLCTNTTEKKLSLYTQQLSRPKCFAKSVVALASQTVAGYQIA